MYALTFLHYKYQKLGRIESLCAVYFNMLDPAGGKKDQDQSRRVSLAVSHNKMAAGICGLYGGRIVKNIGDLLIAAFNTPLEGMLAALEFMEKINAEKLLFRTKSALIHGIVTRVDNNGTDYIGTAVDRCSRLLETALPGQVLTDESTMGMINPFIKSFNEIISRFVGVKNLTGIGKLPVYEVALESLGFVDEETILPLDQSDTLNPERTAAVEPEPLERDLPPLSVPGPDQLPVADRPLEVILEKCTLSSPELEAVSTGYRNLLHILEKAYDLHIRQVHFSGSFARGTMIRPIQPIDIIAVISPPQGQEKKVTDTLEEFKQFLQKKSPGTEVSISRGRVSLVMHEVEFYIIPVLATLEKGQAQVFIPSQEGGFWIARNPAVPELWMKKAVEKNGSSFLPFTRLIKAWQRANCSYLNSLHLEMLTDVVASRVNLDLSLESVNLWFKDVYTLITQNKAPFIRDPGREGDYIDDYVFTNANTFTRFSRVITESYNLSRQGMNYHRAGDMKTSLAHWKSLFGSYLGE